MSNRSWRSYLWLVLVLGSQSCFPDDTIDLSNQFIKFYNEGNAVDIVVTDGGFVLLGQGEADSFLTGIDNSGNIDWSITIPSFRAKDLLLDTSANFQGEYIVLGDATDTGPVDLVIRSFGAEGEFAGDNFMLDLSAIEQIRCTEQLLASQIAFDTDGGLLVFGNSKDCNDFDKPFIIKIDENNNQQWSRELGSLDPLSNVALSKSTFDYGSGEILLVYNVDNSMIRVSKYNLISGNETSLSSLSQAGENYFVSEVIETPGGFAMVGTWNTISQSQRKQIFFHQLDPQGQFIGPFRKFVGIRESSSSQGNKVEGQALFRTEDGGFIILGKSERNFSKNDFFLVRTNQVGKKIWDNFFGGDEEDESGRVILELKDNSFLIFGTSITFNGTKARMTLMKTNSQGKLTD